MTGRSIKLLIQICFNQGDLESNTVDNKFKTNVFPARKHNKPA